MYFVILIGFASDGQLGISLFKSFLFVWRKYFTDSILLARHSLLANFSDGFALGARLTLLALRTLILAIVLLTNLRDILMTALLLVDDLEFFPLCLIQYFFEILLRLLDQTLLAYQNLTPFFVH